MLQPLFDLYETRVRSANFDLRVLPLGVQTIFNHSAGIAVTGIYMLETHLSLLNTATIDRLMEGTFHKAFKVILI